MWFGGVALALMLGWTNFDVYRIPWRGESPAQPSFKPTLESQLGESRHSARRRISSLGLISIHFKLLNYLGGIYPHHRIAARAPLAWEIYHILHTLPMYLRDLIGSSVDKIHLTGHNNGLKLFFSEFQTQSENTFKEKKETSTFNLSNVPLEK